VLDKQPQNTVKQIDHHVDVIASIDRAQTSKSKSKQVAEALLSGIPIIVVIILTFLLWGVKNCLYKKVKESYRENSMPKIYCKTSC